MNFVQVSGMPEYIDALARGKCHGVIERQTHVGYLQSGNFADGPAFEHEPGTGAVRRSASSTSTLCYKYRGMKLHHAEAEDFTEGPTAYGVGFRGFSTSAPVFSSGYNKSLAEAGGSTEYTTYDGRTESMVDGMRNEKRLSFWLLKQEQVIKDSNVDHVFQNGCFAKTEASEEDALDLQNLSGAFMLVVGASLIAACFWIIDMLRRYFIPTRRLCNVRYALQQLTIEGDHTSTLVNKGTDVNEIDTYLVLVQDRSEKMAALQQNDGSNAEIGARCVAIGLIANVKVVPTNAAVDNAPTASFSSNTVLDVQLMHGAFCDFSTTSISTYGLPKKGIMFVHSSPNKSDNYITNLLKKRKTCTSAEEVDTTLMVKLEAIQKPDRRNSQMVKSIGLNGPPVSSIQVEASEAAGPLETAAGPLEREARMLLVRWYTERNVEMKYVRGRGKRGRMYVRSAKTDNEDDDWGEDDEFRKQINKSTSPYSMDVKVYQERCEADDVYSRLKRRLRKTSVGGCPDVSDDIETRVSGVDTELWLPASVFVFAPSSPMAELANLFFGWAVDDLHKPPAQQLVFHFDQIKLSRLKRWLAHKWVSKEHLRSTLGTEKEWTEVVRPVFLCSHMALLSKLVLIKWEEEAHTRDKMHTAVLGLIYGDFALKEHASQWAEDGVFIETIDLLAHESSSSQSSDYLQLQRQKKTLHLVLARFFEMYAQRNEHRMKSKHGTSHLWEVLRHDQDVNLPIKRRGTTFLPMAPIRRNLVEPMQHGEPSQKASSQKAPASDITFLTEIPCLPIGAWPIHSENSAQSKETMPPHLYVYHDLLTMAMSDGHIGAHESQQLELAREVHGVTMDEHHQMLKQLRGPATSEHSQMSPATRRRRK
jgi:hypothetical protein